MPKLAYTFYLTLDIIKNVFFNFYNFDFTAPLNLMPIQGFQGTGEHAKPIKGERSIWKINREQENMYPLIDHHSLQFNNTPEGVTWPFAATRDVINPRRLVGKFHDLPRPICRLCPRIVGI